MKAERGTTYISVVSIGTVEDLLHSQTCLVVLSPAEVVSLPPGVTEVSHSATVFAEVATDSKQVWVESVDLSALAEPEQVQVRSLLQKISSVFSAHDGDLGCTPLISHNIPLLDEVHIRQRYKHIPPSEYEKVKT